MTIEPPSLTAAFEPPSVGTLRVLVVDDYALIRVGFVDYLQMMGVGQLYEAADGQEALEILAEKKVDLVLTDFSMPPGMNGIEMMKNIRANPLLKELPVVMISSTSEVREQAFKLGALDFVPKPLDLQILDGVVDRVLAAKLVAQAGQATAGPAGPAPVAG